MSDVDRRVNVTKTHREGIPELMIHVFVVKIGITGENAYWGAPMTPFPMPLITPPETMMYFVISSHYQKKC
jgi:hypothetical protein